jgi:hypothetical protein
MHMDDDNKLVCAWLEEQVLHIAEQDINMLVPKRRLISKTILVDLNLPWDSFSVQWWSEVDIWKLNGSPVCWELV